MEEKRQQIANLIATGETTHYLGVKKVVMEQLTEDEIDTLHNRYMGVLSKETARSLSDTIISGIASIGCKVIGIKNIDGVIDDLKKDKFTGGAIEQISLQIFLKFGYTLCPLTIGSTFAKHKIIEMNEESDDNDNELKEKVESITENVISNLE